MKNALRTCTRNAFPAAAGVLGAALLWAASALADVQVGLLFRDGAVLQRDRALPVWGYAAPNEAVSVSIQGQEARATANAAGHWVVQLPALKAGGPFEMTVRGLTSRHTLVLRDIAVGEVWVAAGQSNMAYPLQTMFPNEPVYGEQARAFLATVNDPMLRVYTVNRRVGADGPLSNEFGPNHGFWKTANPVDAAPFTAVGYHFAAALRQSLNVPVGIISAPWPGTKLESWTSRAAIAADPRLAPMLDEWEKAMAAYPADQKAFDEAFPLWKAEAGKARAEGRPAPRQPLPPQTSPQNGSRPANIFNGMISTLIPYGIRGVIWYQGESNGEQGALYHDLFPAMIRDWRAHWGQGDFPFLFVQLPNYQGLQTRPVEGGWASVREAQLQALALPNTGMAIAIDLGDVEKPGELHPHNKASVGHRLALLARARVYGEKLPAHSGPLFAGAKFDGREVRITFTHADGGLEARALPKTQAESGQPLPAVEELKGFAIAGKDGKFVWARARIEGDAVLVSSPEIAEPAAVRYSWAMNPLGNLYNKAGLPASPFRTDTEAEQ